MFEKVKDLWQSMFGSQTARPPASDKSNHSRNGQLSQFFRQSKELMQVYDILMVGLRMFTAGQRREAISSLQEVLSHPFREPSYRLAAAGLLAETFRGEGDFVKAQQYYEVSMSESEAVPANERRNNEWYRHYRPRVQFGLITVMRRMLSPDHERIKLLLKDARDQFASFPITDLMAQLNVVEGLYFRQLGDIEGAIQRLKEGVEDIKQASPPYLFLEPQHFEALLVFAYLCSPSGTLLASKLARHVLKSNLGSWSTAVGAAGLLHLRFRRLASENQPIDDDSKRDEEVEEWLRILTKNAAEEHDPLLISEGLVLEIVWGLIKRNDNAIKKRIQQLAEVLQNTLEATQLLRAVELGALRGELTATGFAADAAVSQIWMQGRQILDAFSPFLESYKCDQRLLEHGKALLSLEGPAAATPLSFWNSEMMQSLRARLWP